MKPKVVISSCLTGENVRYDGRPVNCPFVENLSKYVDFVPVCPEVSIGLPVPRDPIIVVREKGRIKVVNPKTGEDLTDRLLDFSKSFLFHLKGIDGFLLKSKSPSCGVTGTKTYKNENGTGFLYRGRGLFAKAVIEIFPYLPVEDELRLKNWDRKFFFLLRIFLNSQIRELSDIKGAFEFHTKYAFLLKIINKKGFQELEKALYQKDTEKYKKMFYRSLHKPSSKRFLKHISTYTGKEFGSLKEAVRYIYENRELRRCLDFIPEELLQ